MEQEVKERLKEFLGRKGISINAISKDSGYPQPTLNKQINGNVTLSVKTILVILDYCQDLSLDWLLRGEGEMSNGNDSRSGLIRMYQDLLASRDERIRELEDELIAVKSHKYIV